MKEPKSFKRPRIYYQEAFCSDRVRIIYPNGEAVWMTLYQGSTYFDDFEDPPCWLWHRTMVRPVKSGHEALRLMHDYDQRNSFPKAEFLGEL